MSSYSLLESKIVFICTQFKKDKQIPISWNDLKGDTLDQFKSYCKLASLEFSWGSSTWQSIKQYSRIRNCIVHNEGWIQGNKREKELLTYARRENIVDEKFREHLSTRTQPQLLSPVPGHVCSSKCAFGSAVLFRH